MKNWKQTLISPSTTILQALKIIDDAALRIALVVDTDNRLLGTVTDGDIRRGLLKHIPLEDPVSSIMNRSPIVAKEADDPIKYINLMKEKGAHRLPVLNEKRVVVGIRLIEDLIETPQQDHWAILMAGGLGNRLRPLTNDCPKPMLPVGGKPILETILKNCVDYGFTNIFISVNYKAEVIKNHFGDGSRWGCRIAYLHEDQQMGTAGAISLLPKKPPQTFLVMNSDLLTTVNPQQLFHFHRQNKNSKATVGIRKYTIEVPYGVLSLQDHRVVGLDEKPKQNFFINAGIYALEPDVIDLIPKGQKLDMTDLLLHLMKNDFPISAFPIHEYWLDIGQPEDFHRANGEFPPVKKDFRS